MNASALAAIGAGMATIGAGIGIGLMGYAALTGMARQPEERRGLMANMLVFSALIEGIALFALVICLMLAVK